MLARAQIHSDELDAGPHHGGPGGERMCAATHTVKPVEQLIRFVVGPDGVVPDVKRKLPGRGLWITADRDTLKDAVSKKLFSRGFKREVTVARDLVQQTEQLLVRSALDALAIAGKSGLIAAGFAKADAALTRERVVALLHAAEARPDGVGKLKGVLAQREDAGSIVVVTIFASAQLDLALGRSNVVHAALLAGPASDTFLARLMRLQRFRSGEAGESGDSVRN
jgi:hypothetical protein